MSNTPVPERDLLYANESNMYVVFAPRRVVEEIVEIRKRLPHCRTWGAARALLSDRWFNELVELLEAFGEQLPPDDQAFEFPDENGAEGWPALSYDLIEGWLPDAVVAEYGERFDNMAGSGVNMPASREQEIVNALSAAGISCERDDRIVELKLFDPTG